MGLAGNESETVAQRYQRAAQWTPQRIAAQTPGLAVKGYWLREDCYFFLAERFDPSLGRILSTPSIARPSTGSVNEVISLQGLARLIAEHSDKDVGLQDLSTADFDMRDEDTLAVSIGPMDYLVDCRSQRVICASQSSAVRLLYSPDGNLASFVRDYDLWVKERTTGKERQLTHDGLPQNSYGQRPETAGLAVSYRKGPWPVGLWSPDSQWFLTHRIDERPLSDHALIEYAPAGGGAPVLHRFKCATPLDSTLAVATFVGIHIPSGRLSVFGQFPTPVVEPFSPLSRFAWFDADNAWYLRFDRYFKRVELIQLDLTSATGRVALSETAPTGYLDLRLDGPGTMSVRTLARSREIIWFSERDGWGHLYLYDALTGRLKNRITHGEWVVADILHVDEQRRTLLFLAAGIDPTVDPARRSLCSVSLDGSGFKVLLTHDGDVTVARTEPCGISQDRPFRASRAQAGVSPDGAFCVARVSSIDRGNRTEIVSLCGGGDLAIASALPPPGDMPARAFSALAADGATRIHGVLFFPSDFDSSKRYPLIDYIYPGPWIPWRPQDFRMKSAQARTLAELGFVTMILDTRGMPVGSRALHQVGYGNLVEPQLADHAAAVRHLCSESPFIDGDRVGAIGQSAGGRATVQALFDYGEIYKVGVAVCGAYDSTFLMAQPSDKYRGPGSRETWDTQASGASAGKLKGKLLLIAGDMDEAVFMSQTLRLADALIKADKDFDLLIVPNEGHNLLQTNSYVQRRVWDYFVRHLIHQEPPADFKLRFEPHETARFVEGFSREVCGGTSVLPF